jgi:hypothetical protein
MDFVAFQQFSPVERPVSGHCIWCGQKGRKNRAHIISRKLTTNARNAPTLRLSVCESCNTACGRLEEWVLRFTPLSWLRLMLYVGAQGKGTSRHVPSYLFSDSLQEWVVFHLDARTRSHVVATQLIRPFDEHPTLLTQVPPEEHEALLGDITTSILNHAYLTDIRSSLPQTFAMRFLLSGDKTLLIARTKAEASRAAIRPLALDHSRSKIQRTQLDNSGRERVHFRWSKGNWTRFCAKAAMEALCLFEGGDRCLAPAFQMVREFVIRGGLETGKEILFDRHGPVGDGDVPIVPVVDLTMGQNVPESIAAVVPSSEAGMHMIAIYEIHGWVLASVVFAGFPPAILVLGGPGEHLPDFYQLIYDEQEESFDFVRLAYDRTKPIIPLPIPGSRFRDLADTYGLMPNAL